MSVLHYLIVGLVVTGVIAGCDKVDTENAASNQRDFQAPGLASDSDSTYTFSREIAPIVFDKCLACHRTEGSAPFPLETYQHVAKRGRQIVEVTSSRYMPPWLPSASSHAFLGNRSLEPSQIETIAKWVSQGMAEGDATFLPEKPKFDGSWTLGPPDLIVELPEPYLHRIAKDDEWRSFVLPLEFDGQVADATRYVRAYDVQVDNPQAVHHAVIQLDSTGQARKLDAAAPGMGFAGMQNGQVRLRESLPNGQLLGWLPGKLPPPGQDDVAWPIRPNDDLVLQLHLPALGKDELVNVKIGLYFAKSQPKKIPYSMLLSFREIDIPPGDSNYEREMNYTFPVDVTLYGIFPHAHYLCEEMLVTTEAKGEPTETLIHMEHWDFNWQDEYRYETPVELKQGTKLRVRYRYNNSASNIQNPFDPPRRVSYGERSQDAMGDLILQLAPATPSSSVVDSDGS